MPPVQCARYQGWPVFTNDGVGVGVGVVIRRVELYDIVKTVLWFRLQLRRLLYDQVKIRLSESQAEAKD